MFQVFAALLLSSVLHAEESRAPIVNPDVFTSGREWTWIYSELKQGTWKPYFRETYRVTERTGTVITVEMSSHPLPDDSRTPAHHKFIADLRHCVEKPGKVWRRAWTVQFYTQSFGNGWQLVSDEHPNMVFTEKFSCFQRRGRQVIEDGVFNWQGQEHAVFLLHTLPQRESSWYFRALGELTGVMALKQFDDRGYKAELVSTGK